MKKLRGFTLVELLVVIGIIALLVGILLPALAAARRQAGATKCAAELREIGTAFQMYAMDNKGYFPPSQLVGGFGHLYNIDGVNYPQGTYGAYWFNFLAKYVTKSKVGLATNNANEAADARKSVFWGCPSWEGYTVGSLVGGVNALQIGYGMNSWPTFAANYTPVQTGDAPERSFIQNWGLSTQVGNFMKQKDYAKMGSQRCLVADSIYWEVDSQAVPASGQMLGQADLSNTANAGNYAFAAGNTLIDAYRHGKFPPRAANGYSFQPQGGKVAFNILYVDGHVSTSADRSEAFRSVRMRFPG